MTSNQEPQVILPAEYSECPEHLTLPSDLSEYPTRSQLRTTILAVIPKYFDSFLLQLIKVDPKHQTPSILSTTWKQFVPQCQTKPKKNQLSN